MKGAKRERSTNFTTDEKAIVLEIAMKYRDIIENKRTNTEAVIMKNEVWQKVTDEFNTLQTSGRREVKHVKTLYENLKRKGYGKVIVCSNGEIQNNYGEGNYSETTSQQEQIPYEQEPLDEKNFLTDRTMDFLEREREIKLEILQQELDNARLQNQILRVNLEIKQIEKRNLEKSNES